MFFVLAHKTYNRKNNLLFCFGEHDNPQSKQMFIGMPQQLAAAPKTNRCCRWLAASGHTLLAHTDRWSNSTADFAAREFCRAGLQLAALFAAPERDCCCCCWAYVTSCLRWYSWRESFMALVELPHCGSCWRYAALQLAIRSTCSKQRVVWWICDCGVRTYKAMYCSLVRYT